MSGRFFTPLLLIAVAIISKEPLNDNKYLLIVSVIGFSLWGLLNPNSPVLSPLDYGSGEIHDYIDENGIADERAIYYSYMGLLSTQKGKGFPGSKYSGEDWIYSGTQERVRVLGPLGVEGYELGPNVHVIDKNALADPLMARLPLRDDENFRIGHFKHQIPDGYLETLSTGENKIKATNIAEYYDIVEFIVRGDLFDGNRLIEVLRLTFGKYDYLIK